MPESRAAGGAGPRECTTRHGPAGSASLDWHRPCEGDAPSVNGTEGDPMPKTAPWLVLALATFLWTPVAAGD